MPQHLRAVPAGTEVTWSGQTLYVRKGTIVDIPPGPALEAAYGGPFNLRDLTATEREGAATARWRTEQRLPVLVTPPPGAPGAGWLGDAVRRSRCLPRCRAGPGPDETVRLKSPDQRRQAVTETRGTRRDGTR
jgi:hypothetical protein